MTPGPDIAVTLSCPAWIGALPGVEDLCRRVAAVGLGAACGNRPELPAERLEISLVLADDAMVQDLNRRYRGQDKPTNVLSFAALDDQPLPPDGPILLGDVVLAYETTVGEAAADGKPLTHHLSHLVVHGVLHLLGHDHTDDAEAEEMEAVERTILAALGIPDPYALDPAKAV